MLWHGLYMTKPRDPLNAPHKWSTSAIRNAADIAMEKGVTIILGSDGSITVSPTHEYVEGDDQSAANSNPDPEIW